MEKRHIEYGSDESFEEDAIVWVDVDESDDVTTSTLQYVGKVVAITGHYVATMFWKVPALIGNGRNFNLTAEKEHKRKVWGNNCVKYYLQL